MRNLNADKCRLIAAPVCGFLTNVLRHSQNLPDIFFLPEENGAMDSLILGLLTLFFAQGLTGRDHWGPRVMAMIFVAGMATAFVYSLR